MSTLAGNGTRGFVDGTGAAARFQLPRGLAVDAAGKVLVADSTTQCIRKLVLFPPPTPLPSLVLGRKRSRADCKDVRHSGSQLRAALDEVQNAALQMEARVEAAEAAETTTHTADGTPVAVSRAHHYAYRDDRLAY